MIRTTATAAALGLGLVLTGCAEAESGGTQPTPVPTRSAAPAGPSPAAPSEPAAAQSEPAAPSPSEPEVRTVDIAVTGTTVDPAPAQVDLAVGETLRLVVTSDAGGAVHAHGFGDLEVPVTPGEPTTVELTDDVPGLYEVEVHDPDLLLLQVAVR